LFTAVVSFALLVLASTLANAQTPTGHLPWPASQRVYVTQDCNDSCCGDHVGFNGYSWDFAAQSPFDVLAPRAGTVVHVKMSSNHGGDDASEVDSANYLVLDHGDGTYTVMLHLAYNSLDPSVRCGSFVRAGQRLARTGSTGWSSGNHLHFQVNRIPAMMPQTCECGTDGMACSQDEAHWELFWSRNAQTATVPAQFQEWTAASACGDRHDDNLLTSRNVDAREELSAVDINQPGRFQPVRGQWQAMPDGPRGPWRQAASSADAQALVSFMGSVGRPGVYEVWNALPARGRSVGVSRARLEVVARGARGQATEAQNVPGGGYRPVPGRFKLTGHAGEGLLFSADGRPAEALAVDGVLLRRVGDVGRTAEGGACSASTECEGDLVCSAGQCRAGCETAGCGAGSMCDATGLCVPVRGGASGQGAVAAQGTPASPVVTVPAALSASPAVSASASNNGQSWSAGAASAVRNAGQDSTGGGPSRPTVQAGNAPRGLFKPGSGRSGNGRSAMFVLLGAMALGTIGMARRKK
jgi:hypothetical protein